MKLGVMYHDGRGVPQDKSTAMALYRQACEGQEVRACVMLGLHYRDGDGVRQSDDEAHKYFRKACNQGDAEVCHLDRELGRITR